MSRNPLVASSRMVLIPGSPPPMNFAGVMMVVHEKA